MPEIFWGVELNSPHDLQGTAMAYTKVRAHGPPDPNLAGVPTP